MRDVDQRIGDRRHARLGDQRDQLRHVVVVHRVHRREMRAGRRGPCRPSRCVSRASVSMCRDMRVVGLVAVHVDPQPALRRDLAQDAHRLRAVGHRALEMRNAADHVDALVERALEIVVRARRSAARRPAERRRAAGRDRARRALARRAAHRPRAGADRRRRRASGSRAGPCPPPSRNRRARARRAPPCVSVGFSSPHSAMPSSSVPDALTRGRP